MSKKRKILLYAIVFMLIIGVTFASLHMADAVAGHFFRQRTWPDPHGLLFRPNSEQNWEMYDYTSADTVNSLGIRDYEVAIEKTHACRILAIGDSFTFGWGVNIDETWVKRLESNLRARGVDAEVLNLGKPAANPNEYEFIAELSIPLLKPDMVILGLLNGDDLESAAPNLLYHFPHILRLVFEWKNANNDPQWTVKKSDSAAHCREWLVGCARQLYDGMDKQQQAEFDRLEPLVKQVYFDGTLNPWLIEHSTREPDYFMRTTDADSMEGKGRWVTRNFRNIRRIAQDYGASVLVVSLPEGFYVNEEAYHNVQRIGFRVKPEMMTTDVPERTLAACCEKAGIPFLSLLDEFRKHKEEPGYYFELDRHLTVKGNVLAADAMTEFVAEHIGRAAAP